MSYYFYLIWVISTTRIHECLGYARLHAYAQTGTHAHTHTDTHTVKHFGCEEKHDMHARNYYYIITYTPAPYREKQPPCCLLWHHNLVGVSGPDCSDWDDNGSIMDHCMHEHTRTVHAHTQAHRRMHKHTHTHTRMCTEPCVTKKRTGWNIKKLSSIIFKWSTGLMTTIPQRVCNKRRVHWNS